MSSDSEFFQIEDRRCKWFSLGRDLDPVLSQPDQHVETLTEQQIADFKRDGFVFIPAEEMWTSDELKVMLESSLSMQTWPDKAGAYMKYYEPNKRKAAKKAAAAADTATSASEVKVNGTHAHTTASNVDQKKTQTGNVDDEPDKILQRLEKFLDYNSTLSDIFNGPRFINLIGQLFGEEAIIYKEKLNFKMPGGQGFRPHQDAAAGWWLYNQSLHISALVSLDPSDMENGALELVRGKHTKGLLNDQWKEIPDDLVTEYTWEMAPTKPGDVVFFDSFVPHASGPNNTDMARRILYLTYAKKSEGDWREKYYADKRASFPPDIERDPTKTYQYKV